MKKGFSNIKSCVNIYEVINLELYVNQSLSCVLSKSICVTIKILLLHSWFKSCRSRCQVVRHLRGNSYTLSIYMRLGL